MFIIRFPGSGPLIKRIRFDVADFLAVADNPTVPPQLIPREMFEREEIILGRVGWVYNRF